MHYKYFKLTLKFRSEDYTCLLRIRNAEEEPKIVGSTLETVVANKYHTTVPSSEISHSATEITEAQYMQNDGELERHRVFQTAGVIM